MRILLGKDGAAIKYDGDYYDECLFLRGKSRISQLQLFGFLCYLGRC